MDVDYKLNYNHIGEKRKFKLPKKRRIKIIEISSWIENDLKNQWIYKDYKCYYIIISMFKLNMFKVSCSGYTLKRVFKTLDQAKFASLKFCDKLNK